MLRRFIEGGALPEDGGHMRWQYFSSAEQDQALFRPEFLSRVRRDPFEPIRRQRARVGSADRLAQECYVDLRLTMPDSVLMKVDKMSMAHSLEVRVPFLDHALVEFVASIPSERKFPGSGRRRSTARRWKGMLPEFVLNRGKQGYSLPIKNWLRTDLRDYMDGLLRTSPLVQRVLQSAVYRSADRRTSPPDAQPQPRAVGADEPCALASPLHRGSAEPRGLTT